MTQVDLAGRWKHGWVPLGPIAIREKAKGNPKTIALYKKRYKAAASKEINRRKTAKAKSQAARSKESTLDRVRADIAENRREAQAVIPKPQEGEKVGRDGYSPSQRKYIRENFDRLVKDGKIQYMKPVSKKMPNGMTQKTLEPSSEPTDQVRMPGGGIVATSKFKQQGRSLQRSEPKKATASRSSRGKRSESLGGVTKGDVVTIGKGKTRYVADYITSDGKTWVLRSEDSGKVQYFDPARQTAHVAKRNVGPGRPEMITNAAKMYGTDSPQYREAKRRFGAPSGAPKTADEAVRAGKASYAKLGTKDGNRTMIRTSEKTDTIMLPDGSTMKAATLTRKLRTGSTNLGNSGTTPRRPASSNVSVSEVREYVNSKSTKELEEMLERNLSARVKAAAQKALAERKRKRRTP